MPSKLKEADLHPIRYETYSGDYEAVHRVWASLLGLPPGTKPCEADFKNSARYTPRSATSNKEPPELVTPHWLPILEEQGCLADCTPSEFIATDDWVPLYTPDRLGNHIPPASAAYGLPSKVPGFTAVVPAALVTSTMGPNKEFILTNFHCWGCLKRQSLTVGGKRKQVAFCLYCGCLLYTSPSPRDATLSRMPSSA